MDRLLQLGAGGLHGMGQVSITRHSYDTLMSYILQPPPGVDTPMMDTAETVYISSLALLKVNCYNVNRYQIVATYNDHSMIHMYMYQRESTFLIIVLTNQR